MADELDVFNRGQATRTGNIKGPKSKARPPPSNVCCGLIRVLVEEKGSCIIEICICTVQQNMRKYLYSVFPYKYHLIREKHIQISPVVLKIILHRQTSTLYNVSASNYCSQYRHVEFLEHSLRKYCISIISTIVSTLPALMRQLRSHVGFYHRYSRRFVLHDHNIHHCGLNNWHLYIL